MRQRLFFLAACSLFGCSTSSTSEKEPRPEQAPAQPAPVAAKAEDSGVQPEPNPSVASEKKAGWSRVETNDEVPLCVFGSQQKRAEADFLHQVKKQKLVADTEIVFGAFGPGCMNEACDARPTLQCWVDREGTDVLVVHTRFYAEHKDGSVCTEDCKPVIAGCATEPLKAGKYTVKYGDKAFPLRIPSVVAKPCYRLTAR